MPVGTATNKATGPGTKYLKLPNSRVCGADQIKAKFKGAAGDGPTAKIKKATYFVNGKKSKTVHLPIKNERTTLTDVDPAKSATVKVKIKLFEGGTKTVSRSYLSCT